MSKGSVKNSTNNPKIGVFVCHCGKNIAGTVDVKQVVKAVANHSDVVVAEDHMFMCSKQGIELIKDSINNKGIDRTVVASCSKTQHGKTFAKAIEEEGLNKHLHFQVNIREHCSWVHGNEKEKATEKATQLVKAGINRSRKLEPIRTKKISTTKASLVIGAGIAGLRAAYDMANLGIPVHLVERESSIGGHMVKLNKTFPTNECPQCSISPLTNGVVDHPNITLHTLSTVKKVEGSVGNFDITIETRPRYVKDNCTSCGECSEVCPEEVPSKWNMGMNKRKAIYKLYPQAIPSTYVRDKKACVECYACIDVCPVDAIDFDMGKTTTQVTVGTIIIATGYQEYNPSEIEPYHYSEPGYENVITQLQLERMMSPDSSTGGKIRRPSDGKQPEKVVMIQCVGSRSETEGNEYCSGICCMFTTKNAGIIKDEMPGTDVTICYIDIRTPGLYYEEYYKAAQKKGVRYIRGRPSDILRDTETGELQVLVDDTLTQYQIKLDADLVVLSAGLVPPKGIGILGSRLQVLRSKEGFVKEFHLKMNPTKSSREGIFIAGAIQGPKDITSVVSQAGSAATSASAPLVQGYVEKELLVPEINDNSCVECGMCVTACPTKALTLEEGKIIVNEIACSSCGICVPSCPTGAIQLRNFREDELLDEIIPIAGGL